MGLRPNRSRDREEAVASVGFRPTQKDENPWVFDRAAKTAFPGQAIIRKAR